VPLIPVTPAAGLPEPEESEMTATTLATEADFRAALERDPEDHTTRLVFADWLEERDDPRAAWYRMLGRRALRPQGTIPQGLWWWRDLPDDWDAEVHPDSPGGPTMWTSVRAAEDAAASAFARLPPERRAELLS
jgi:uncharacterized protein (TIGR02996 family)